MIRNYLKIAWRNIVKRKFYSSLNIIGLSIGMVFTFLIGAYVWNELQINRSLKNAGQQYFLKSVWKDPNLGMEITTFGPLSKRLKDDYPGLVANYYRWDGITSVVTKGDNHFREGIQLGDSTLLSMFGFKLLHGDPRTALEAPYSVVITKALAKKYFGKTDVVGQTLNIQSFSGSQRDFAVTGILDNIPENSVLELNDANRNQLFIPTNTFKYFNRQDFDVWANQNLPSYIELKPGVTAADLEQPIKKLMAANTPELVQQNVTVKPVLLKDYYLSMNNGLVRRMIYALSFVAIFILLMAIVNFVNISISSSSSRIREIGVRKALGGLRKQLIAQFLTESFILVALSTMVAIGLYPLLQDAFEGLVGKKIPDLSEFPVYFLGIPALIILIVGALAGLYPAFVLSSLKSVDSLKGKLKSIKENVLLRKSLAGFQFCIAAIVMIAAFIVTKQVSYFFGRSLGYNKEFVLSSQVPRDWSLPGVMKMETVRREFARMPEVSDVTLSYEIPNGNNGGQPPVYRFGQDSISAIPMQSLITDEHYASTYQIPVSAGTFFKQEGAFDSSRIVLNGNAAKALGWVNPQDAIGQLLRIPNSPITYTVSGVVDDFHFGSMNQKIQPMIFFHPRLANAYRFLSFKVKPGQVGTSISAIVKKWATLLPGTSFEYVFMDDALKKIYKTELQLKNASYTATVLSMVIVLLGVLGMVSLSIQKRTKEIGIRKVLGASVPSIILLFIREFLILIGLAGLIACPIALYLMRGWLSDYAYRISLTPGPFLLTILALGVVTASLIVMQTVKAGIASPVKSLRSE